MIMNNKNNGFAIALDGPVASGKSTIALLLAQRLQILYLDTGAMYRAVTCQAIKHGVSPQDWEKITQLAEKMELNLKPDHTSPLGFSIWADGEDLTGLIHNPEVNDSVSYVAEIPGVRQVMVREQRKIAQKEKIIMAGRDIGTVVLPEAQIKIFLTAALEERVRRRFLESQEKGLKIGYSEVEDNVKTRDKIDSSREVAPLKPAPDSIILDCTNLTVEEVVLELEAIIKKKSGGLF